MNIGFEKFKVNLLCFLNEVLVNQIRCIGVKCGDCPLKSNNCEVCLLYELQLLKIRLENETKIKQSKVDIKSIPTIELVEEFKRRME